MSSSCLARWPSRRVGPSRLAPLLVGLALVLVALPVASAAGRTIDARLTPTLVMQGRITSALRVRGEHVGERITRRWSLAASGCGRIWCRTLRLTRQRSDGRLSRLTLRRTAPGTYTGSGRFFVGLSCLGHVHRLGEVVPYRVTLRILHAITVGGVRFADRVSAIYVNPSRQDHTVCPLGPSHDSAVYTGAPISPPSPPAVGFSARVDPATDTATFTDTTTPGGDGARPVRWSWDFGDTASGAADHSTQRDPVHTFSAPGTYTVTLTVTDSAGVSASQSEQVVAPGPPTADFSATSIAPLTLQFTDGSVPGPGGAAIAAWAWNFGDPTSGPADASSAQDPMHTFTAPGTYTVCLTVTDTNGRTSSPDCQPVKVG